MAITNYAELKAAVADWTHRADMTSYIDNFISLTEAKLNRKLRLSEMENSTTIAATTADVSFPTGFLEMREINVGGSPDKSLEYISPYRYVTEVTSETGIPRKYTIQADTIKLFPFTTCDVEMIYFKEITPLDSNNTSNFVLNDYPDMYLHGVLSQAFSFMMDSNNAVLHAAEFEKIVDEANRKSNKKRFSGVPLQVVVA